MTGRGDGLDGGSTLIAVSRGGAAGTEVGCARHGRAPSVVDTLTRMEPADVTAVPTEVVAEVLRDPMGFLDAAAQAAPGWSEPYGGPEGVAQLTSVLHARLAQLTKLNADLRISTLVYLRTQARLPFARLGELLGITRQRVQLTLKAAVEATQETPRRFAHLESKRGWEA